MDAALDHQINQHLWLSFYHFAEYTQAVSHCDDHGRFVGAINRLLEMQGNSPLLEADPCARKLVCDLLAATRVCDEECAVVLSEWCDHYCDRERLAEAGQKIQQLQHNQHGVNSHESN